jgi:hypothetical protein
MAKKREPTDAERQEEARSNPPGLGPLEHAKPPRAGEPDLEAKSDEEEDPHD